MNPISILSSRDTSKINHFISILKDNNIDSYIFDEQIANTSLGLSSAIGGAKLMVRGENYEKALYVLKDFSKEIMDTYKNYNFAIRIRFCPECESEKIVSTNYSNFRIKFNRFFNNINYFKDKDIKFKCLSCENEWDLNEQLK